MRNGPRFRGPFSGFLSPFALSDPFRANYPNLSSELRLVASVAARATDLDAITRSAVTRAAPGHRAIPCQIPHQEHLAVHMGPKLVHNQCQEQIPEQIQMRHRCCLAALRWSTGSLDKRPTLVPCVELELELPWYLEQLHALCTARSPLLQPFHNVSRCTVQLAFQNCDRVSHILGSLFARVRYEWNRFGTSTLFIADLTQCTSTLFRRCS